jgi:hypothetical protein
MSSRLRECVAPVKVAERCVVTLATVYQLHMLHRMSSSRQWDWNLLKLGFLLCMKCSHERKHRHASNIACEHAAKHTFQITASVGVSSTGTSRTCCRILTDHMCKSRACCSRASLYDASAKHSYIRSSADAGSIPVSWAAAAVRC